MKSPFQFGRVVVGETFTNRTTEIKRALEKKEIIDTMHKKIVFIDPVFELWFKKYYSGH